jgi:hypothetical protein
MTTDPTTIMHATERTMRSRYVKRRLVTPCCATVPEFAGIYVPTHGGCAPYGEATFRCGCGHGWILTELSWP